MPRHTYGGVRKRLPATMCEANDAIETILADDVVDTDYGLCRPCCHPQLHGESRAGAGIAAHNIEEVEDGSEENLNLHETDRITVESCQKTLELASLPSPTDMGSPAAQEAPMTGLQCMPRAEGVQPPTMMAPGNWNAVGFGPGVVEVPLPVMAIPVSVGWTPMCVGVVAPEPQSTAPIDSLSASVDALHAFVKEKMETLSKDVAHERQARQAREAREGQGVGGFAVGGAGPWDLQREVPAAYWAAKQPAAIGSPLRSGKSKSQQKGKGSTPEGERQGYEGNRYYQEVVENSKSRQEVKGSSNDGMKDMEVKHARDVAETGGGLSGYATVVIQQIPFAYTVEELMYDIDASGFKGLYDYFYLPGDPRSERNRGFAFVNFLNASAAQNFYHAYHGKSFERHVSGISKAISVLPADTQGFEECAKSFFDSCLRHNRRRRPVFLRKVPSHLIPPEDSRRTQRKPRVRTPRVHKPAQAHNHTAHKSAQATSR